MLGDAQQMLSSKPPAQVMNELSEQTLELAERIWQARIKACGESTAEEEEPLRFDDGEAGAIGKEGFHVGEYRPRVTEYRSRITSASSGLGLISFSEQGTVPVALVGRSP